MTCTVCNKDGFSRLRWVRSLTWACADCQPQFMQETQNNTHVFTVIPTVNYKNYYFNGGNVPKSRVDMIKKRTLSPEDGRTVVMRDHSGKITDRKAYNY